MSLVNGYLNYIDIFFYKNGRFLFIKNRNNLITINDYII